MIVFIILPICISITVYSELFNYFMMQSGEMSTGHSVFADAPLATAGN